MIKGQWAVMIRCAKSYCYKTTPTGRQATHTCTEPSWCLCRPYLTVKVLEVSCTILSTEGKKHSQFPCVACPAYVQQIQFTLKAVCMQPHGCYKTNMVLTTRLLGPAGVTTACQVSSFFGSLLYRHGEEPSFLTNTKCNFLSPYLRDNS